MSNFPPLPALEGELLLEVFSYRSSKYTPDGHESSERLAELGSSVLNMVIVYTLFSKRPLIAGHELKEKHQELLDTKIPEWLSLYGLKSKVRGLSDRSILDRLEESRFLFNSYVGGVYVQRGFPTVVQWISRLIDPDSEGISVPGDAASPPPYNSMSPVPPMPPAIAPPPTPGTPPPRIQSGLGILATFNQTCSQQGLTVNWDAVSDGPPHQPRWVVRCLVNNVHHGTGTGRNQKLAKEDAAKQALRSLGWGSFE
ncbi:hypothetical protein SCLCIDRAFT_1207573 [Scleroderma citrinum Foug A]|uniref:DRBM domain-containing protein n=1 Tax=Scleroderma citrinum Foug A TaxID=1036808 RepID=A0A0C3EC32_9AGAM|nr:hypothetical protein SCLCIDRAFT_1207573 [Scleroderma citrinum Foug A]